MPKSINPFLREKKKEKKKKRKEEAKIARILVLVRI
jgi:hypothetical protein